MGYPITITVSTGRCGTVFLTNTFQEYLGDRGKVLHEAIHAGVAAPAHHFRSYDDNSQEQITRSEIKPTLDRWIEESQDRPVIEFGWTAMSLIPYLAKLVPDQLRIIVIHRHPVEVAASFAIRGHYSINKNPAWAISPSHDRVLYPNVQERWVNMSPYEKCLYRWLETTAYGLEVVKKYPNIPSLVLAAEDVFKQQDTIQKIAELVGVSDGTQIPRSTKRNQIESHHRETTPLTNEWRRTFNHPEVMQLAQQLGYPMDEQTIQTLVRKYQLPVGLLPSLRHYLCYWQTRRILGGWWSAIKNRN